MVTVPNLPITGQQLHGTLRDLAAEVAETAGDVAGLTPIPPGRPGQIVAYGEAGEPVARTLTPDSIGAAPAVHTHPANQITDMPDLVVLFENKLI